MNVLALCAGVGGLELGLPPWARTVAYVEREAYVAAVLRQRMEDGLLEEAPIHSDLRSFDGSPWRGRVDLVTGGYPCQPFSAAGKRLGSDDPRHLWPDVFRVLQETAAPPLFVENVRGHVSKGLREVLWDLSCLGFNAEWDVFSAEEEGAPHRRERVFVFAYRDVTELRQQLWWSGWEGGEGKAVSQHNGQEEFLADAKGGGRKAGRQGVGACAQEPEPDSLGRWPAEPDVGRVAHGVSSRVDQLRALGNAVVPATAARAWAELTERALA